MLVLNSEPTNGAVGRHLAFGALRAGNLLLTWALQELQHLLHPQVPELLPGTRLEGRLKTGFLHAGEVRLVGLPEERCTLVALHADPSGDPIDHCPAADAHKPALLVAPRALQYLDGFADFALPDRLAL